MGFVLSMRGSWKPGQIRSFLKNLLDFFLCFQLRTIMTLLDKYLPFFWYGYFNVAVIENPQEFCISFYLKWNISGLPRSSRPQNFLIREVGWIILGFVEGKGQNGTIGFHMWWWNRVSSRPSPHSLGNHHATHQG